MPSLISKHEQNRFHSAHSGSIHHSSTLYCVCWWCGAKLSASPLELKQEMHTFFHKYLWISPQSRVSSHSNKMCQQVVHKMALLYSCLWLLWLHCMFCVKQLRPAAQLRTEMSLFTVQQATSAISSTQETLLLASPTGDSASSSVET